MTLQEKLEELIQKREEKRQEGLQNVQSDLEKAKANVQEVKELDAEIEQVKEQIQTEQELNKVESEEQREDEEAITEPEAPAETIVTFGDKPTDATENTSDMDQRDKGEQAVNKEQRNQNPIIDTVPQEVSKAAKTREDFRHFLITGEERALTTQATEVVVPEDIKNEVIDLRANDVDALDSLVTIKKVKTGKGSQPVLSVENDLQPLPSVEELAENPELALVPLADVDYAIKTYRGYIKASREVMDDAIGAEELITDFLKQKETNTRNSLILKALNTLPEKTAASADDLKTLINTAVKGKFRKNIIMSQSAYNALDLLKDGNGRYLLEDSITKASGTQLGGLEVKVYDDEIIGKDTLFIGDLKQAVVLFDRSQYTAKWTDYMHYGECLMVAVRLDAKLLNPKAAVRVKFTSTPTV